MHVMKLIPMKNNTNLARLRLSSVSTTHTDHQVAAVIDIVNHNRTLLVVIALLLSSDAFCLGTEVPRLSALGVGPTVRGTSEVQSAQEWKCKVYNSILQNGGLD